MRPRSIRARLTMMNALVLVTVFAVTGVAAWAAVRDSVDDTADDELRMRVQTIWVDVSGDLAGGSPSALRAHLTNGAPSLPGVPFRIATDGHWVWMSPGSERWGDEVPAAAVAADEEPGRTSTIDGHPVRLLAAQFSGDGRSWIVEAGMPMTEFYEAVRELAWLILLGSPAALLLAAAAGHWMSGRALAPVATIASTARSIGVDNLSRRLPLRGVDDELDRLSQTLNATFARLEASFRRITQFTADASHELRTPVAIMRTAAEVARERPRTPAEYVETLSLIARETERMSLLIDDLLLLAREDAGAPGSVNEPLDLAEVVRDACDEGRHLAAAAGLNVVADIPRTCASNGDAESLRRLFLVLLDNAVKYTQRGGTVTVRMVIEPSAATISVEDTGIGIRPRDREQIFERFYRVDSDRGRRSGGVGLGLSIARAIVMRHGGSIAAASASNGGSVFRVTLPIAAAETRADSSDLQSDVVA